MSDETYRVAAFSIAITACVVMLAIVFYPAIFRKQDWRAETTRNHPLTILGIPTAGCSSFIVITFFGAVNGPIKLSFWGLVIEGAGGPVVMWIACMLAMALAARMTWDLKP